MAHKGRTNKEEETNVSRPIKSHTFVLSHGVYFIT